MKNTLQKAVHGASIGILLLSQCLGISTASASNLDGNDWNIKEFNATVVINKNSTINVTEHIVADFTNEEHHGIFRDIPIKYIDTEGKTSEIPIHIHDVKDENGNSVHYETSNRGEYLEIKIGDPNVVLTSLATYSLTYSAEQAIGNYKDHDELFWNATGNKWPVPIEKASATVKINNISVDEKLLQTKCYTGISGSREQNCTSETNVIKNPDGSQSAIYTYTVTSGKNTKVNPALKINEGLTIVAGFPKNIIDPTPPTQTEVFAKAKWYEKIFLFFYFNPGLLIPFLAGGIMYLLWYTKGRDQSNGKTTIMPIYTPPDDLKPTEIGTIIDETIDMRDISSSIVDLAIRGYLRISETKEKVLFIPATKYTFHLLKTEFRTDNTLANYEKNILRAIFGNSNKRDLEDLNNEFYKYIPDIKSDVYKGLVKKGYFPNDPDKVRATYQVIGFVIMFIPFVFLGALMPLVHWSVIVGVVVSGAIILAFAGLMPARTLKGSETRTKILGLEEFIKTAETDRLKFQEKENIFEKILPYAMTLGIAGKWTKAFEGIYKTPPNWYQSNDPNFLNNFSTVHFLRSINSLSTSMGTTFQSTPRSSGSGFSSGGFSGGGGGGGGGGAW